MALGMPFQMTDGKNGWYANVMKSTTGNGNVVCGRDAHRSSQCQCHSSYLFKIPFAFNLINGNVERVSFLVFIQFSFSFIWVQTVCAFFHIMSRRPSNIAFVYVHLSISRIDWAKATVR